MLGAAPAPERRRILPAVAAVDPFENSRSADFREHNGAHREGAERGLSLAAPRTELSERRLDRSAATQVREQALDSVSDDAGPQSDQC